MAFGAKRLVKGAGSCWWITCVYIPEMTIRGFLRYDPLVYEDSLPANGKILKITHTDQKTGMGDDCYHPFLGLTGFINVEVQLLNVALRL